MEVERTDEPEEDRALRVLEVVERHRSRGALGPVVGGTIDPPAVELDLDVVATSSAEAYEQVVEVIGIIDRYAGLGGIRTASVVDGELVLDRRFGWSSGVPVQGLEAADSPPRLGRR